MAQTYGSLRNDVMWPEIVTRMVMNLKLGNGGEPSECELQQTNRQRVGLVPIAGVIAAGSVDEGRVLNLDIKEHTWLKWESLLLFPV